jgi:hypothetical protein
MTCSRSVILPLHVAAMQIKLKCLPDDAVHIMVFKQQHEKQSTINRWPTRSDHKTNPHKKSNAKVQRTVRTI